MKHIFRFTNQQIAAVYSKLFNPYPKYYKRFFKHKNFGVPNGKRILFYTGIGFTYLTPIEVLMYHLLKSHGYEVDYLIYNKNIRANEIITKDVVQTKGLTAFWNREIDKTTSILSKAKVSYSFIDNFTEVESILLKLKGLKEILTFNYGGIDFGEIVKGVMYRYYKSLSFDDDAITIAKNFLHTSLTNYFQIRELCEKYKYQYVFFSHGINCTWQPVALYCKKNGINYICYDRSKTRATANFNINKPSPVWDFTTAWERLRNYNLSEDELSKVNEYLKERELQKGDVYAYNFSAREKDITSLRKRFRINEEAKIITLFTNLIWDAANVNRNIAFHSMLDCIIRTIKNYNGRTDVHILIRSHPAEKVLGTKERYGQLIKDKLPQLPDNVTIIEPEENINSFTVIELSDIGVVNTSTIGIEMAISGKPILLISETHYRGKGFTYDITNAEEYFKNIEAQLKEATSRPDQVMLANKYFYLMMFEYQHKMPMTFTRQGLFNGYGYDSFADLVNDKEIALYKIIKRIVEEKNIADFIFR